MVIRFLTPAPDDIEGHPVPGVIFNGADDPMSKPEQVSAFKAEMDKAGADYILIDYPGALHAFTNPDADELGAKFGLPLKYDAEADNDSWARMTAFLKETFASK